MDISMIEGCFKVTPLTILPERLSAIDFWIFSILIFSGNAANYFFVSGFFFWLDPLLFDPEPSDYSSWLNSLANSLGI